MHKEEFINRWKHEIAGLALFGHASSSLPALTRAGQAMLIPAMTEKLLADIYDSLQPAKPAVNGKLPTENSGPFAR